MSDIKSIAGFRVGHFYRIQREHHIDNIYEVQTAEPMKEFIRVKNIESGDIHKFHQFQLKDFTVTEIFPDKNPEYFL